MEKSKRNIKTNLLLLLFGRMISDTGTGIQAVIMPLYIIDKGGSAATVGLFSFLSLIPTLLVYPFAGVLGDRLNRKQIMVVTDFASAIVILGLAYVSHTDRMGLNLLLAVQVIVSILYGFFDPATKGMLPQLVSQEELTKANSSMASLRTLSGVLSPVIGAVLYAKLGVAVLFLINGISFVISGCCSALIGYKNIKMEKISGGTSLLSDLSEGIKFIIKSEEIRNLCMFLLLIFTLIQPLFTVALPLFFKNRLDYTDTQYGYLQSVMIFGALLGSILVGFLFGKEKVITKSLMIGVCLQTLMMSAFSVLLFPFSISKLGNGTIIYLSMLAGVLCLLSVAVMFINVPVQTFIQKATPNEYMSRVFSIVGLILKGGMPFGALIYGLVLSRFEAHWAILTATILMMLISAVFLDTLLKRDQKIKT